MSNLIIGPGTRVTLHFSIALEDGTLVDSNFDKAPATFEVGDGNLLPSFEEVLFGMAGGQDREFAMPPEKAFGQHNPSNIQVISRKDFGSEFQLEKGLVLSFADAKKAELPGVVADFDDQSVSIDFNHPLAGHTLTFRVAILRVLPVVTH
jgi:FKBP-type peptidyl-prolyl cis-trans isomerase SlpA